MSIRRVSTLSDVLVPFLIPILLPVLTGVLSIGLLSACSADRSGKHAFSIALEAGIPVAVSTGGPRYAEELFAYDLLLILREDEREQSLLNRPGGFTMDEAGRFYVADTGNDRIAVFGPDGRYERSFGRQGQGPGEFESVGVPVVRDGIVTTVDGSRHRVVRYRTDGTLFEDRRLPGGDLVSNVRGFAEPAPGHSLLHRFDTAVWPARGDDAAVTVTVWAAGGDTLWSHTTERVPLWTYETVTVEGEEMELMTSIPFAPYPDAAFSPVYGLVMSSGAGPELEYRDLLTGAVTRRVRLELQPEAPTAEEKERIQTALREQIEASDIPLLQGMLEAQRKAFDDMPAAKAAWTNIQLDEAGYLWLRLPDFSDFIPGNNAVAYRIVSPEGEYLGLTTVPPSDQFRRSCRGRFLLRREDEETGAVELCVYAIRPLARGLAYPE